MKNRAILTALILYSLQSLYSQKNVKSFLVVSYNVENLFDTIDSPLAEDEEFTPGGAKAWTRERYAKKLNDLGRVIGSIPGNELPAIIGLTEIENRGVLEDLVRVPGLRDGKYAILKEEWMLYESERYGALLPSATYGGPEYYGGPSDHLPIYVEFNW